MVMEGLCLTASWNSLMHLGGCHHQPACHLQHHVGILENNSLGKICISSVVYRDQHTNT